MVDWKYCAIGDLCDVISNTYKRNDKKVILINTSDVLEGAVLNHTPVANENLKGQFKKTFKRDDILYSEIRPANKRFAYINFDYTESYIASTKLMVLRPRKDIVLPRFLYAVLKSQAVIDELQHLAETRSGTFPQITFSSELAPMRIMLPDFKTQQQIVSILSAFDDKIELNNKINENLEQQAKAIFIELFITNANPNWKIGTISDLGNVVGGGTPSKKVEEYYTDSGIAWITPKDLSNDKSKFIAHGETDITDLGLAKSSATLMPRGTVLFSSRAPIGYIAIADGQVSTNQGFKSIVPFDNVGTAYIYYFLKENLSAIENVASGSTFKEISGSTMKNFTAIIPDSDILSEFQSFCNPIFEQQRALECENRYLSALRDTLLPKLMNGEIDVSAVKI